MTTNFFPESGPLPEVRGSGIPKRPLSFLHTSDVHINDLSTTHDVFQLIVDLAIKEQVDLLIVAGDLFDHPRVSDHSVAFVVSQLQRLACRAVVIPGNHDFTGPGSLYARINLSDAGPHVSFLGELSGTEVIFPELDLAVWGRGLEIHSPENSPLQGYRSSRPDLWRIAVAHGHYFAATQVVDRSSPIRQQEIEQLDCDYLALGHWHRRYDVSGGSVVAYYSGSPSEGEERGVNLVRFHDQFGVQVEWRPI